jgi:hypothetical protein
LIDNPVQKRVYKPTQYLKINRRDLAENIASNEAGTRRDELDDLDCWRRPKDI